jgi:hypothetical protein
MQSRGVFKPQHTIVELIQEHLLPRFIDLRLGVLILALAKCSEHRCDRSNVLMERSQYAKSRTKTR